MKHRHIIWSLVVIIIVALIVLVQVNEDTNNDYVKIGVITDVTGPAAYWGESTRAGVELAVDELREEGIHVEVIIEDYQLDATKAVSSAQKLVNINKVDALYAEFNPAAISVGSFLRDKDMLYFYNAAVASPLKESPYTYKTYLDYQEGCRAVADAFHKDGVTRIGVLKVNLEFGDLCLTGVREIYGDAVAVEGYTLGDTDFRTQLLKMNSQEVEAVINVGFEGDTYNALKAVRDLGYDMRYGTVDDTITEEVAREFADELRGGYSFGFTDVDTVFSDALSEHLAGKELSSEYGAALAYTHIKQIAKALNACDKDNVCATNKINEAHADSTIGFEGFQDRTAVLKMRIKKH